MFVFTHYTCHLICQSIDVTSESMSRQISRQTSQASTTRRISSIREEDLRPTAIGESPDEVFPKERKPHEKPTVMMQVSDARTMTAPEIQEHVGGDMIRRQDSTVREIVDGPIRLKELRGVPIQQIEEVVVHFNPECKLAIVFLVDSYQFLVKVKLA